MSHRFFRKYPTRLQGTFLMYAGPDGTFKIYTGPAFRTGKNPRSPGTRCQRCQQPIRKPHGSPCVSR